MACQQCCQYFIIGIALTEVPKAGSRGGGGVGGLPPPPSEVFLFVFCLSGYENSRGPGP